MKLTVNQIRERLGKLVTNVFTDSFIEMYEMIAPQFRDKEADVIASFYDESDAYIQVVSENLSNCATLELINRFLYPPVAFSVYARYYLVTCTLRDMDQTTAMQVPDADQDFLTEMLIDYWKRLVSQQDQ